ncbi:hypothetical protein V8E55_005517, partial [Tylopilus felleus]
MPTRSPVPKVECFWSSSWSLSSFLYLYIRYTSLGYTLLLVTPTASTSTVLLFKLFVFAIPIAILCRSVITLRIWFLFSRKPPIKFFAVCLLVATAFATTLVLAIRSEL